MTKANDLSMFISKNKANFNMCLNVSFLLTFYLYICLRLQRGNTNSNDKQEYIWKHKETVVYNNCLRTWYAIPLSIVTIIDSTYQLVKIYRMNLLSVHSPQTYTDYQSSQHNLQAFHAFGVQRASVVYYVKYVCICNYQIKHMNLKVRIHKK